MRFTLFSAVIRSGFAFLSGSMALHAQGIYSFADFLTKVINLVSIRIADLPPSQRFPFGYGKIQFFSSLIIGLSLTLGAIIFLYENILSLSDPIQETPSAIALIGAALSVVSSEIMFRYLICVGNENNNSAIKAAALDNRMDAYSSIGVLIGVSLALLGWLDADRLAAIGVSILVMRTGAQIAYDGFSSLMDAAIPAEIIGKIERMVRKTPQILEVEYIRGRNIGDTFEITMRLAVDETISLVESHNILSELKKRIKNNFDHISNVHIEFTPRVKPKNDVMDSFMEALND